MKKNKRKFILLTNKGLASPPVAAIEAVKVREFPLQLSYFYTLLQAKSSYNEFTFIVSSVRIKVHPYNLTAVYQKPLPLLLERNFAVPF